MVMYSNYDYWEFEECIFDIEKFASADMQDAVFMDDNGNTLTWQELQEDMEFACMNQTASYFGVDFQTFQIVFYSRCEPVRSYIFCNYGGVE